MAYVRLLQSAVDPADVDEVRRLFREEVKPVFERMDGCESIDLLVNVHPNVGGLVEGCALSRWASLEQLERGVEDPEALAAQVNIRRLLRQEPVTRTFEVLD